mmetsp:Transcript_31251/g.70641  ORF Transcript_31251/g.70641 Transcript_31251/m.70641 type:complete len:160 (-) Transcript_31251:141-620(-)
MSHVAFEATHQWMVWVALFYMNIVYSLLSLPFIALALPLISTILTQAVETGYDQAGFLGGKLSPAQIKRKREFEAAMARQKASLIEGSGALIGGTLNMTKGLTKDLVTGSAAAVKKGGALGMGGVSSVSAAAVKNATRLTGSSQQERIQLELASILRLG